MAASGAPSVHRFKPVVKTEVGGLDLDAVAVEYTAGGPSDFRLELGSGLFIYWALPAGPSDRLRLALVDCAVAHVDVSLEADPWIAQLAPLTWAGLDLDVGCGPERLRELSLELSAAPPSYRCRLALAATGGPSREVVWSWRAP